MADNHNSRSADKDVAFLGDDDPLAELTRIAGFEPQSEQATQSPSASEPDEFDFDLEAELLRSFDVSETPATFVENVDEPAADEISPAVTSDGPDETSVEELPAFLQRRPPAEDRVMDEQAAAPQADSADLPDVEEPEPVTRAPQAIDEEWVDLPEWTRPSGQSRIDAFERTQLEVDPVVDEPADAALHDVVVPEPEPVAAVEHMLPDTGPDADIEPEPLATIDDTVAAEDIVPASDDPELISSPYQDTADDGLDETLHELDFSAIDLNEEPQVAVEEWHGATPADQALPAASVETPQAAPAFARATDWDIADDLEQAFRELETGTLPRQAISAAASSEPEQALEVVLDDQAMTSTQAPDVAEHIAPVAIDPVPDRSEADVHWTAPEDGQVHPATAPEVIATDWSSEPSRPSEDASVTAQTQALVDQSLEIDAAPVDDFDLAIDFDDLELELQAEAQQPSKPLFEPEPELEPEPQITSYVAPAVAVAPLALASGHWHVAAGRASVERIDPAPEAGRAPVIDESSLPDDPVDDVGPDLAFNIHEVASTDTFIEPLGEIDVPELPRDEDWQAIDRLDDLDLSGVEAEFADILSQGDMTAPPATTDPSRMHETSVHGQDGQEKPPVQIDFADFDFTTLSRPGFAGVAAATAPGALSSRDAGAADPEKVLHQPAGRSHAIVDGFDDERGLYAESEPSGDRPKRFSLPFARRTTALALVGAFVVVAVGAYALSGGGEILSDEPRVIAADSEPIKVVPEDPGGRAVPNQDQAVYDQVDGTRPDGEAQLVSRAEEPVDIVQRTLDPEVLPLEGRPAGDDISAVIGSAEEDESLSAQLAGEDSDDGAMNVAARRVQTMVVRPDGTLVPREDTASSAATDTGVLSGAGDPLSPTTLLAEAASDAGAAETAAATLPQDLPGEPATDETAVAPPAERLTPEAEPSAAPAEPALTAPVRTVETTALTGEGAPVPPTRPGDQPVTIVGNASQPDGQVPAATPESSTAPAEVAAAQPQAGLGENPGGYVVQIASQPTQESAQSTYQSLSSRFGSIIGGRGYQIQAAEIPDRGTFYRVRVAGGTREEAVALCERYQAAGGSCFVAR